MARIVLVEDDDLTRRMYEEAFGFEKDYQVTAAANGKEGLEAIKQIKPDIVLLDIMMPEMNGLEVLEHLKADKELKKIPVIILTNLAGNHDVEEALARGAVKYIIKGESTPKEVIDAVEEILAAYTRHTLPPVS